MDVRDEVCGMRIDASDSVGMVDFQGRTYHFCSDRCRRKFEENPGWYVPVTGEGGAHDT